MATDIDFNSLIKKLSQASSNLTLLKQKPSALVGFDGFTDNIIEVVKTRESLDKYTPMKQIEELGHRILESSSVSCNIELITKRTKIGGNGPILANALLAAGHLVSFIGAIGDNGIEPLFQDFAKKCHKVFTLAKSARTDALEFEDGKVLLGKHNSIIHIDYQKIISIVGKETLIELLDEAKIFVSANWTMLPLTNQIWENLQKEILPFLSHKSDPKDSRYLFIDLADPRKREDKDLLTALNLLKNWGPTHKVILGLNASEAARVADLLKITSSFENQDSAKLVAKKIKQIINLDTCLIHTKQYVVACNDNEEIVAQSPYCQSPIITTGAGDNFNAGFCSALLYNFNLNDSVILAIATAGYYIRHGNSPNNDQVQEFLTLWQGNKL